MFVLHIHYRLFAITCLTLTNHTDLHFIAIYFTNPVTGVGHNGLMNISDDKQPDTECLHLTYRPGLLRDTLWCIVAQVFHLYGSFNYQLGHKANLVVMYSSSVDNRRGRLAEISHLRQTTTRDHYLVVSDRTRQSRPMKCTDSITIWKPQTMS